MWGSGALFECCQYANWFADRHIEISSYDRNYSIIWPRNDILAKERTITLETCLPHKSLFSIYHNNYYTLSVRSEHKQCLDVKAKILANLSVCALTVRLYISEFWSFYAHIHKWSGSSYKWSRRCCTNKLTKKMIHKRIGNSIVCREIGTYNSAGLSNKLWAWESLLPRIIRFCYGFSLLTGYPLVQHFFLC